MGSVLGIQDQMPPGPENNIPGAGMHNYDDANNLSSREDKGIGNGSSENGGQNEGQRSDGPTPPSTGITYLNEGEEDQMELYGFRRSRIGTVVTWSFIVLTLGILRMVFHWFPEWFLKCTHNQCSLEDAERVLIVEIYQKKYRRVHIRTITCQTAIEALAKADDPQMTIHKGGDANEHVMQELNRACETPTLSLPNDDGTFREVDSMRMFTCKKLRYIWNEKTKMFSRVKSIGPGLPTSTLHRPDAQQGLAGLSALQQRKRRAVYGPNIIDVPVRGILELLILEVLNPFYIFQLAAIIIWMLIYYYSYAAAIALMSFTGAVVTIVQIRRNQRNLRNTVRGSDVINVCRGTGVFDTVRTEDLVPGDIIIIPPNGCTMHCDAILLFGTCIVNESMLTGESVPVTKTPLPVRSDIIYHVKEHSRHTLFSGTKVVQTRFYDDEKVLAVVTSTGYLTAKGSLVSSIMYPPPADFRFERDSYKFVAFLAGLASIGFTYNVTRKIMMGETGLQVILHSFDVITVCVPPALPAAMAAGIIMAQRRLKSRNIFCISPRAINVSGSINVVCFDKTGTLTEDGLDLWGVVPVAKENDGLRLQQPVKTPKELTGSNEMIRSSTADSSKTEPPLLLMGMATCHSLTIIDGVLGGDPLDIKMFESTESALVESSAEDTNKYDNICPTIVSWTQEDGEWKEKVEVGIVRQFPFSSALQRMGVLTKRIGEADFHFFCKGSPEMVHSLSDPSSIPGNYHNVLDDYTVQGYRVIALAHRVVNIKSIHKLHKIQREEFEHGMTFLGLVVLENRLKPDTTDVIRELSKANVRTIMATGDNLHTAISVARDCEIVGPHDEVVIVNLDEATSTGKPRLTYTLAETASLQRAGDSTSGETTSLELNENQETVLNMDPSVGRKHLAMNGKVWSVIQEHYPDLVAPSAIRGTIFARMSPDQKQQLVQELQRLGYYVGMCGDGANDCGALKAAHAGIALTDSEASVASPFTSKEPSISCVPELIRQGRCALVTSFGIFNYMATYALTQFVSVMILFECGTNLSNFQYLYADLFIICSLSAVMGRSQPYRGPLFKKPPLTSLLTPPPIGSLIIQVFVIALLQAIGLVLVRQEDFFIECREYHNYTDGMESGEFPCYENYAVFGVSLSQYIFLALAYSKGYPYREIFLKNFWLVVVLTVSSAFSLYLLLGPSDSVAVVFDLLIPPDVSFRFIIVAICVVQVVLCLVIEAFVVDIGLVKLMDTPCWLRIQPRKEKYPAIKQSLEVSNWPDVTT